jgi:hypothetical protein
MYWSRRTEATALKSSYGIIADTLTTASLDVAKILCVPISPKLFVSPKLFEPASR